MKERVIGLLADKRYEELIGLLPKNKRILSILISLTYDKKSLIAWRAIEAVGIVSREIAETKPEIVRNLIGRLLWMIRDESGGIGWSSPEMLGEIVRNNPERFSDVAPIIMSFLEEEFLSAGVLWAIGRIGRARPELVKHAIPDLLGFLDSTDSTKRGLAAWALGEIGAVSASEKLEMLTSDGAGLRLYEYGELRMMSVGEIAQKSLKRLRELTESD